MAALILFQLALGFRMTVLVSDLVERFRLTQLHKSWGTVIFALALIRIAWRLAGRRHPGPPPGMPRWQARAAAASHLALYLLMLVMPVSGWVMASAAPTQDLLGIENLVFGRLALPDPWVPGAKSIENAAAAVHLWSAIALAMLLALHVSAAAKHLLARDEVVPRMTFGP
jgi:cytochrome b561